MSGENVVNFVAAADEQDTSSLRHADIGKLHAGLQSLNQAIEGLENAPMFGEVERAKVVIAVNRDLIAEIIFALHLVKNDLNKLKGAINVTV